LRDNSFLTLGAKQGKAVPMTLSTSTQAIPCKNYHILTNSLQFLQTLLCIIDLGWEIAPHEM
jgi:hypothetical protein